MCLSCGCGMLHENHGDSTNITVYTIRQASKSAGNNIKDTIENLREGLDRLEESLEEDTVTDSDTQTDTDDNISVEREGSANTSRAGTASDDTDEGMPTA